MSGWGRRRCESPSTGSPGPLECLKLAKNSLVRVQTRGRRAGVEWRRVPYNMGTPRIQPRNDICAGRRRVAATATGLSLSWVGKSVFRFAGDAGCLKAKDKRIELRVWPC